MRRGFLFLVICMAAVLVAASPVAANSTPTTGTRINLFDPPTTFPANTPFYIEHGSACEAAAGDTAADCMNAATHFDLYLDGTLQPSKVDIENSPEGWIKLNLTNYPDGLTAGRHTFVGVWIENGSPYNVLSARINFR